jgi:hypothetical protein
MERYKAYARAWLSIGAVSGVVDGAGRGATSVEPLPGRLGGVRDALPRAGDAVFSTAGVASEDAPVLSVPSV